MSATTMFGAGLALVAIVVPGSLAANGGTLRLSRIAEGPYLVSAWTQPSPPRVGRIDVSVAVMTPDTGEAVLNARARLSAQRADVQGGRIRAGLGRGGGGNLLLYHANLEVPDAGRWRVLIDVEGPAGVGQAAFELDVQPPRPFIGPILGGLAVLTVSVAVWWARTRRRMAVFGVVLYGLQLVALSAPETSVW